MLIHFYKTYLSDKGSKTSRIPVCWFTPQMPVMDLTWKCGGATRFRYPM